MRFQKGIMTACAVALTTAYAVASPLTPEDYCDTKRNAPARIKDITPLADGQSYAAISDDGKSIDIYSYKTGKKTGVLFSIDGQKGELKIDEFSGYQLSANGRKLLLWNNVEKIYRHSFTAEYYVYDMMRSTVKRVSSKGPQRGAVISHDGRFVAYERGNNIFISSLDYETDNQITTDGERNKVINGSPDWGYEEEFGMLNSMCWSADDNVLAFIRFDESEVPTYSFDNYRSFCDADPMGDPYPSAYTYKYPLSGYQTAKVSVNTYDLDNRKIKKMDLPITATDYVPLIQFGGADGMRLMVMVLNHDQTNLRLFDVNPLSTVGKQIYSDTSTDGWLSPTTYQMVDFATDGFVIASEKSGYRHLYQYDYSGSMRRQITKGDFNVTAYYGKDNIGRYFMQTTSLGAVNRNIAMVDAKGIFTLLNKEEGTASASFSSDRSYYVQNYSNTQQAPQYRIFSAKGVKMCDLELNEAYMKRFASAPKAELLKVKNDEGEEMDAYIIKPADFDSSKSYPLMMYQYNGPDSQEVTNSWKMGGNNYIASEGFVVAAVDGRGTGNRTRKWAYSVYKNLGVLETVDQLAGARYFASLPYVDSARTSCFGWSYGGYMTLMEMGAKGSPFKAGVAMAPVADWRWYDAIYTERYMLTPGQNSPGYQTSSAMGRTAGVNGRLLIMSGTSDDNVHFYNTLKYSSKLNFEGKIFDMMAYTGFEHSLGMCNARVQFYRKVVDFLKKNL
ncbi:MAG: prolyl oligopeptidase family serine peptidase [Bacteroides sp.]|nr:prolyl oligopeptidase family serine peptidase [Bacteroides sp.]